MDDSLGHICQPRRRRDLSCRLHPASVGSLRPRCRTTQAARLAWLRRSLTGGIALSLRNSILGGSTEIGLSPQSPQISAQGLLVAGAG